MLLNETIIVEKKEYAISMMKRVKSAESVSGDMTRNNQKRGIARYLKKIKILGMKDVLRIVLFKVEEWYLIDLER